MKFVKMHGLGNDFALVDDRQNPVAINSDLVRRLAERRTGIGFDQLLLLEAADDPETVCRFRVFNADGSEAQHCGNGMRCIGLYLHRTGAVGDDPFRIEGAAGPVVIAMADGDTVTVKMGTPAFEPAAIPFQAERTALQYDLEVNGRVVPVSVLSMGNPHAVLQVDDAASADVAGLGSAIERHERFPERVNVGFMQVLDRGHIRLRVHERGAGETRACGTGACAAVVAGRRLDLLDERVAVTLPGGELVIEWSGVNAPVWMTGSAAWVYEGTIEP